MKKIVAIFLMALMFACSIHADDGLPKTPQLSPTIMAEINKPLESPSRSAKMTTGSWICLGAVIVVGAIFGSMAWNTRRPL